jgi:hypothetical protein
MSSCVQSHTSQTPSFINLLSIVLPESIALGKSIIGEMVERLWVLYLGHGEFYQVRYYDRLDLCKSSASYGTLLLLTICSYYILDSGDP